MAQDIASKLQLRPGQTLACFSRPLSLDDLLPYPAGETAIGPFDAVLGFCAGRDEVAQLFATMRAKLRPDGVLWFAFRKGRKPPEVTRDHGWDALNAEGYHTVRAIALDATWSALRFRPEQAR